MKQFGVILRFEMGNYLKNKTFIGVTVFLVLALAILLFFPRIAALFKDDGEPAADAGDGRDGPVMLLDASDEDEDTLLAAFSAAFPNYEVRLADGTDIESAIADGEAECAFVLEGLSRYTYYVDDLSLYDMNTDTADEVLGQVCKLAAMTAGGMTAEQAADILAFRPEHAVQTLGTDQGQNFFYTYIMIFALYMVILLYGQMVATSVATEKSSRAMELLITSAKPVSMMFGKVIAACLAGLSQLVCVFGAALLFYRLNRAAWGGNMIMGMLFDMPPALLGYMLLYFVLGFFLYAFMFGAVGSTATKLEDINTSVLPVTVLFIVGFFVVVSAMSSGTVNSALMKICSYVPFTSPIAMFTRIAMSTVSWVEIALSTLVLAASVIGIGVLAARIYKVGVLLYGSRPRLGDILRSLRKA